VNWIPVAAEKRARYDSSFGEQDERALVRRGNTAYAAGLALLMAGDPDAGVWLQRAASRWRESWDLGGAPDAWGRPVGALKASLLADDEARVRELAGWALGLDSITAVSAIGRYAAALALLSCGRWAEARAVARSLQGTDEFPRDVADALAGIAAGDGDRYAAAVGSVVESFERREEYLENVPVADTALVLATLARRRGIGLPLPASATLPARR
jgi:hypothetical protein